MIPAIIRRQLKMQAKTKLFVQVRNGEIVLTPAKDVKYSLRVRSPSMLFQEAPKRMSAADVLAVGGIEWRICTASMRISFCGFSSRG